jgi:MFS family permease
MSLSLNKDAIPNQRWLRILPPIVMVYMINFIDRANIAFAMAGGMNSELGLTASVAGMAAGIFFIGYLVLQVPGGDFAAKHSAKNFVTFAMVSWGVIAMATGFVQNAQQLLIARFLLGAAEGGTYPALLIMISNWFPRDEIGRANSIFMCGSSAANFIVGPMSGWIISVFGWREVFYIEGALPVLALLLWIPMVSNRPEEASWLNSDERKYLTERMAQQQAVLADRPASYREILRDPNLWKLTALYFLLQIGISSYIFWIPTILRTLTNSGIAVVGLLSSVPYLVLVTNQFVFGTLSDKTGDRRLFMAIPAVLYAIALVLSVLTNTNIWVSYVFLALAGGLTAAQFGIFWTAPPALFPHAIAGGARGIINALGNVAGFVGPTFVGFAIQTTHSVTGALCALAVVPILACGVIYSLPASLSHDVQKAE